MPRIPCKLPENTADYEKELKRALESLPPGSLPLEQGTSRGGFVDDSDISITVIKIRIEKDMIQARLGVFFTEIIVGCSCGDDPVEENAYCEMLLDIDKTSGETEFIEIY